MTLTLSDPDPDPPEAGKTCTFTVTGGDPTFTWSWKIGDGLMTMEETTEPTYEIDIPAGAVGKVLTVKVKAANGEMDAGAYIIAGQ